MKDRQMKNATAKELDITNEERYLNEAGSENGSEGENNREENQIESDNYTSVKNTNQQKL